MKYLSEVPMLQEIDALMERLTDAAIQRAGAKMPELDDDEEALGVVANPVAHRLLAVAFYFRTETKRLFVVAAAAPNDEEEHALLVEAERTKIMVELCMEMAWGLVKQELGLFARDGGGIQIGQHWMVAACKLENSSAEIGKRLIMRLIKQQEDDD